MNLNHFSLSPRSVLQMVAKKETISRRHVGPTRGRACSGFRCSTEGDQGTHVKINSCFAL